MNNTVQSLWVGDSLSTMEKLSINSFLKNGHEFHLYLYKDIEVPPGTVIKDANEILPENSIFYYGPAAGQANGSVSAFSNLFRYEMLYKCGGFWVDLDVICLKHFDFSDSYVFHNSHYGEIGSDIIKSPVNSEVMKYAVERCLEKDLNNIKHTEIGPMLVKECVEKFNLVEYIKDVDVFSCLGWKYFFNITNPKFKIKDGAYAIHLWNEMWRRHKKDKDKVYSQGCVYEQLKSKYL